MPTDQPQFSENQPQFSENQPANVETRKPQLSPEMESRLEELGPEIDAVDFMEYRDDFANRLEYINTAISKFEEDPEYKNPRFRNVGDAREVLKRIEKRDREKQKDIDAVLPMVVDEETLPRLREAFREQIIDGVNRLAREQVNTKTLQIHGLDRRRAEEELLSHGPIGKLINEVEDIAEERGINPHPDNSLSHYLSELSKYYSAKVYGLEWAEELRLNLDGIDWIGYKRY